MQSATENASGTCDQTLAPDTGLYYYRARYYDPAVGRFLDEDPARFDGGINFYAYVTNNAANFVDPTGLQHTPGGPWHPPSWIPYGCLATDDCATLSWKIDTFKRIIAEHLAWDAAHGVNTHTLNLDIPNHMNGLNYCIELHQAKCTNKCPPQGGPVVAPEPVRDPAKVRAANRRAVEAAVGGAAAGYIIYRIIRMVPSLFPPLWPTIPANVAIP